MTVPLNTTTYHDILSCIDHVVYMTIIVMSKSYTSHGHAHVYMIVCPRDYM